ncbi:acyl carrier protein [Streptomyces sp. NPDC051452]|uniref:acyl carrier protein n=1 Tax=Streptomyces sp. NPDC051452 TaxID=3365654 RepID=UPI0037ADB5E3
MPAIPAPGPLPLDGVRTGLLDCLQVNLAVLADHFHGAGTHLRLGARLDLPLRLLPDGLPTADPALDDRLKSAAPQAGLDPVRRSHLSGTTLLDESVRHGGVLYVVADAFHLPWLPYHGNAHMEHSFLLVTGPEGLYITDGYRIETRWGAASPGTHVLDPAALRGLDSAEAITFAPVPPAPATPTVAAYETGPYLTAYATWPDRARALEQLSAETWLLARARKLHAARRAQVAGHTVEGDAERAHLAAWDKLVEQTYLAARRVGRGRAEPPGTVERLGELLAADHEVFADAPVATDGDAVDPELRRRVAAVAAGILGVPSEVLLAGATFDSLPSFSSFRLVEIVERVESELGRELDADELIPENLRRVDDLCRIARPA